MKTGDIYFVSAGTCKTTGSEQRFGRPAIVIGVPDSNSVCVVPLTTQIKKNLPTHVKIYSSVQQSTALCEQISTVSVSRLTKYCGHITRSEMIALDKAVAISIGAERYVNPDETKEAELENQLRRTIKLLKDEGEQL